MTPLAGLVDIAGPCVATVAGIELPLAVLEQVVAAGVATTGGSVAVGAGCRRQDPLMTIDACNAIGSSCCMVGLGCCRLGPGGGVAGRAGRAGCACADVAHGAVAAGCLGRVVMFGLNVTPVDGVLVAENAIFRRRRNDTQLERTGNGVEYIAVDVANVAIGTAGIGAAPEDRIFGDDVALVMSGAGRR